MKNILVGVVILVVIGGLGYFLIGGNKNTQPSAYQPSASPVVDLTGAKQIAVSAKEFAFTPSTINVNQGEKVAIIFKNDGTFSHNLTIGDLGLATKTVAPGEADTLVFTADKTGTFSFNCTVDSHKDKGMVGKLIVK